MMNACLLGGASSVTLSKRNTEWSKVRGSTYTSSMPQFCGDSLLCSSKGLVDGQGSSGSCSFSLAKRRLLSPVTVSDRRPFLRPLYSQLRPNNDVDLSDNGDGSSQEKSDVSDFEISSSVESTDITSDEFSSLDVKRDLILLSLPAIAGQALEPLVQLMETAYIGRLGPIELASAGVSISIINIVSKLFNVPLLSVTTSFVAEDLSKSEKDATYGEQTRLTNGKPLLRGEGKKQLSSVSTALFLAVGIGIFEAVALLLGLRPLLDLMGISLGSPMYSPAKKFLSLRALGAPAAVVSLALQGILRGFKDTKTPVFCLGVGNFAALFLFPILIYSCQLGLLGAAISTVVSQYIVTFLLIWFLSRRVILLPPNLGGLKFGAYLKSGLLLLGRTLAVLITMTIATSMAARQGPLSMAAYQICSQVWLAVSLLTDALATSSQALIASSVSRGDFMAARETAFFVLQFGVFAGASLAAVLGVSFDSLATIFTKDLEVLEVVKSGALFVAASQPFNALAFIFDGLHFGVSDFHYAAFSMIAVGVVSSGVLLYAPRLMGLHGVWLGLTLFMALRTVAGIFRLQSKKGPWWFLHSMPPKYEAAIN